MNLPASPFLRFLLEASVHLDEIRDADRATKKAVRLAREAFEADEACLASISPGYRKFRVRVSLPGGALWTEEPLEDFLRGRRPRLEPRVLYGLIERRGRRWGVLVLRNRTEPFGKQALAEVGRLASYLTRMLRRMDRARIAEVREKLDRKMMEQLRPMDLFYQILHGLRSLTRYDHSAAVLVHDREAGALEVAAEQVSWRKGASRWIDARVPLDARTRSLFESGRVHAFDRRSGRWHDTTGREDALPLAALLGDAGSSEGERKPMSLLLAPLVTHDGLLGVLEISACHPGWLAEYEAQLVKRFLPVAAVAMRNMGRTTSLEVGMLEAERKNALATLARSVSHDVNNAFGSVLPLVQQLIEDAKEDRLPVETLVRDLEQVEASLQVCRRIFGGMLSFARGIARSVGEGDLARAIEGTTAVLEESLRRRGIELCVELPERLPLLPASQSDLEQLLLNLATNAHDAMDGGGRLSIDAWRDDDVVRVCIGDTGCGIPEEDLSRIKEPFYTTKEGGNGLGLSICRSIVWKMRGRMSIDSRVEIGTRVTLELPVGRAPGELGRAVGRSGESDDARADAVEFGGGSVGDEGDGSVPGAERDE